MKIKNYYRQLAIICGVSYAAMGIVYGTINVINSSVLGGIAGFLSFSAAAYILITIWQDCKREKKLIEAVETYTSENNIRHWRYLSVNRYCATIKDIYTEKTIDFHYDFDSKCFKPWEKMYEEFVSKEEA